jgi:hypothetical protein
VTADLLGARTIVHERDGTMATGYKTSATEREAIQRANVVRLLERYASVRWVAEVLGMKPAKVEQLAVVYLRGTAS